MYKRSYTKKTFILAVSLFLVISLLKAINIIDINTYMYAAIAIVCISTFIIKKNIEKSLIFLLLLSSSMNIAKTFNRTDSKFIGTTPNYFTINFINIIAIFLLIIMILQFVNMKVNDSKKLKIIKEEKILIYPIVFILYAGLNIFFALKKELAFYEFLRLSSLLIIYMYIAINGKYKKNKEIYFNVLGVSLIFQLFIGMLQKIKGGKVGVSILGEGNLVFRLASNAYEKGFSGTTAHASLLALYSILVLSIILYCMKKSYQKYIYLAVATIIIILCASRTVIVLMMAIYFFYSFINRKNMKVNIKETLKKLSKKAILILVAFGVGFFILFGSISINMANRFLNSDLTFQVQNRINHWKLAIDLIKDRPITGYGFNNYTSTKYKFTDNWITIDDSKYSGGSYIQSTNAGNTLTYDFEGTYIGINAITWNLGGKAKVYIDDKHVKTIDLYRKTTRQRRVFTERNLDGGKHTLKIVTIKGNSKATGVGIDFLTIKNGNEFEKIENNSQDIKYSPDKMVNNFYLDNPVHNAYLLYWAEGGIGGLVLFLYINISNVIKGLKLVKTNIPYKKNIGFAMLSIMVVYFVYNISGWAAIRNQVYLIFWIISAFVSNTLIERAGNKDEI